MAAGLTIVVISLAFSMFEYGLGPRPMDADRLMQVTGSQFNAWLVMFTGALAVLGAIYALVKWLQALIRKWMGRQVRY